MLNNNDLQLLNTVILLGQDEEEERLQSFLEGLTIEQIKKIQLVMYIGRGYIDTSISEESIKDPKKLYNDFESTFIFSKDKSVEEYTIMLKYGNLVRYINQGIDILS